jgi:hypothetical protein
MLNFGDVFVFEKEIEVQNISGESKPDPVALTLSVIK